MTLFVVVWLCVMGPAETLREAKPPALSGASAVVRGVVAADAGTEPEGGVRAPWDKGVAALWFDKLLTALDEFA